MTEPSPDAEFRVPRNYEEALRGLQDPVMLRSDRYQTQQHRANREGADPTILEFERLLVKRLGKILVPVFATEVWRNPEYQDELYRQGRSKAPAGLSPHNHGMAVDIVHSVRAWSLHEKEWDLIGHVGKELAAQKGFAIEWGGDWKFYDPAHWEIKDWRAKRL